MVLQNVRLRLLEPEAVRGQIRARLLRREGKRFLKERIPRRNQLRVVGRKTPDDFQKRRQHRRLDIRALQRLQREQRRVLFLADQTAAQQTAEFRLFLFKKLRAQRGADLGIVNNGKNASTPLSVTAKRLRLERMIACRRFSS